MDVAALFGDASIAPATIHSLAYPRSLRVGLMRGIPALTQRNGLARFSLEGPNISPVAGPLLASGSYDCSIRVWDVRDVRRRAVAALPAGAAPACLRVFRGHSAWVVALDSVGTLLGSGSYDCAVRVWDCGDLMEALESKPGRLPNLDADEDRDMEAETALSEPRELEGQEQQCSGGHVSKHVLLGHAHAVVSVCAVGSFLASGSYDHSIRLWCLRSGRCVQILHGHSGTVWAICQTAAAQGSRCVSGAADNSLRVWTPSRLDEGLPVTASLHGRATSLASLLRIAFCYALCALQGRLAALAARTA